MKGPSRRDALPLALSVLSGTGCARAIQCLAFPNTHPAAFLLGIAVGLAALAAITAGLRSLPEHRNRTALRDAGWVLAPGLLAWLVPWLAARMPVMASSVSFSRIGALRLGTRWIETSPSDYILVCFAGLALTGMLLALCVVAWLRTARPWIAIAIAIFAAGTWRTIVFPPSGDEPYILLTASSLLRDGEMDLADDFARGDETFVHSRSFREDYETYHRLRGRAGSEYTYHGLLLPVIYVPAYSLLGRIGLQAVLAVLLALFLSRLLRILILNGVDPGSARLTTALFAAASPLPYYAVFFGSDFPFALLLLLALDSLLAGRRLPAIAILAILPWIHHKGAMLGFGIALGSGMLFGFRTGAVSLAVLGASLASLALTLAHTVNMPLWPPSAALAFGSSTHGDAFSLTNVPRAALSILFDRYRSLSYYPAFMLVFAGLKLAGKRTVQLTAAVALPYVCLYLFFGGAVIHPGTPARELTAVLPVAAFPLAAAVARARDSSVRSALIKSCLASGFIFMWIQFAFPALAFVSGKERLAALALKLSGLNPFLLLPSLGGAAPAPWSYPHALLLLALLAFGSFLYVRGRRLPQAQLQAGKSLD